MSKEDQTKQDKDKQEFFKFVIDNTAVNLPYKVGISPDLMDIWWQWIESKKTEWQREAIKTCTELVQTHIEHDGSYCDTGADMDWQCRSECTSLAVDRLRDYYEDLTSPTNKDG